VRGILPHKSRRKKKEEEDTCVRLSPSSMCSSYIAPPPPLLYFDARYIIQNQKERGEKCNKLGIHCSVVPTTVKKKQKAEV